MPVSVPGALGDVAERAASRKYGLRNVSDPNGFYDAVYRSNGRKVQIKSASYERADGPGVVRVWESHLKALEDANGSLVLVVVSRDAEERPVRKVVKLSPSEVRRAANGRWRRSKQASMDGMREARFRWPELV